MRRAHHSPTATRNSASVARRSGRASSLVATSEFDDARIEAGVEPSAAEVLLSPAGTFVNSGAATPDAPGNRNRDLAIAIRQRIESRLHGRVRNLAVRIVGDAVVLEGQCATYYSKQLAQHAALGVLEHEHLENAIVVCVPR